METYLFIGKALKLGRGLRVAINEKVVVVQSLQSLQSFGERLRNAENKTDRHKSRACIDTHVLRHSIETPFIETLIYLDTHVLTRSCNDTLMY